MVLRLEVMFNKQSGVFYRGKNHEAKPRECIERLQNHSTKSVTLGSPNKG